MARKPIEADMTPENTADAEQRFLRNLSQDVGLRMLAQLMADGMDPDDAYEAVRKMEGKGADA